MWGGSLRQCYWITPPSLRPTTGSKRKGPRGPRCETRPGMPCRPFCTRRPRPRPGRDSNECSGAGQWRSLWVYCSVFTLFRPAREALEALDRQGWQRSFHQRLFHDNFIRACARIFWKTEPPGAFARDHQKILEMNGWDHLSQEILVSTPRR